MASPEEITAAMKALHFERNGPNSGRRIPWDEVPALTRKALELDAKVALDLANDPSPLLTSA